MQGMLLSAGLLGAGALQAAPTLVEVTGGTLHQALMAVAFDQQNGVAVGAGGEIDISQDGGRTWKQSASPVPLGLLGVDIKQSLSIAVGQGGLILVRDAGADWSKAQGSGSERLFSVAINSKGYAVAVGAFGTVLASRDRGKTWQSIAPQWPTFNDAQESESFEPHMYAVVVDEAGAVTIAGEMGTILRSTDGGATWKAMHRGDHVSHKEDASIFAMEIRDDEVGYAVGQDGMILRSTDAGANWKQIDSGTRAILLGVSSSAKGDAVVTGMHDMLYSKDDGLNWHHVPDRSIASSWYVGIARSSEGSVLVVGNAGKIMRFGG
jgi:photosystem II stability/assembly factor-like uncharacterized protein